ncbi:MAG: hypothetical protein NC124_20810, partial [Clostridium sp.]|nr:hypothetical protein [Clostridium sp.]
MDIKIRQFVYRVRARLREQQIIENLIRFAGIGLLVAVILSVVSLWIPFYYAVPAACGIVGFCFVLGVLAGIYRTPTPTEAALKADAKGYKEKISTAFFLRDREDAFSCLQKKDALALMEEFQIRKEFPLRLPWRRILVLLVLSLVFAVSNQIVSPARETARLKQDVAREVKEDIARLEKVEKRLAENNGISETELAEIREQLENAKRELSAADSGEDIRKAEERIMKKMEMAAENTQNRELKEIVEQAAEEVGEAAKKRESDYADAESASNAALDDSTSKQTDSASEQNGTDSQNGQKDNRNSDSHRRDSSQDSGQNSSQHSSESGNGNGDGSNSGNEAGNKGQKNSNSGNAGGQENGSGDGWNYGGKEGREGAGKTNENITVPEGEIGDDENLTGKTDKSGQETKEKSSQSRTWSGNKVSYGEVSGK